MKTISLYKIIPYSILMMFFMASCIVEDISYNRYEGYNTANGDMVYFNLQPTDVDEITVTRATATDIEKVIYSVYALAFDNYGNCFFKKNIYDGFETSTPYNTSQALGIPKQTGEGYDKCTIWVIANVHNWTGAEVSYNFDNVKTLNDLMNTYGMRLLQQGSVESRSCLPMTGYANDVNMTEATSIGSPIELNMERILARISFKVNVVNSNLEFYFNNWTVENMPRYTNVIPQENDITKPSGGQFNQYYPSNDTEKNLVTVNVNKLYDGATTNNTSETFGYYMYENRKGNRGSANWNNLTGDAGDYSGLEGKTDETGKNPKYKTLYAPENASFIILTGLIRDKQTLNVSSFTYKIALGANNYNDYNIRRNHDYVYNININGITYDDITVDAFDSRVHKAYALNINTPYCDKIDAHFDKRYIDITASKGTLDLQFYDETGTTPIEANGWIVMSDENTYNIGIDKSSESTSKTYQLNEDINSKRIYVYTDENLNSTSRSVVLKVTHTPDPGSSTIVKDPVSRTYTFTQAGIIDIGGMYVESYEEYAMDIDPQDGIDPILGLQWGWHGTEINVYGTDNGYDNTLTIINTSGNPGDFENGSLYKDYAARYCYNKNKRNADGTVSLENYKWYLPSVNELIILTGERGVTTNSGNWEPTTMSGKGYWSSNTPTSNETTGKPDNWIWGQLIWDIFVGDYTDEESTYEYRNTAKSISNAQNDMKIIEFKDKLGWQTYTAKVYQERITPKFVRAVRIKDNN